MLTIIFSGMVSGITSYVVNNKFPKFIWLGSVNDVIIHDSKVELYGGTAPPIEYKKKETKKK
ncbi:hypothetical protein [Candidatus Tisiphia endosymbiont of Xenochironomus xenolabis]|uniref:hypothetical protein n=1 Tax=Candidatus Tisiphia endosymbiont of Xenochironomus xenolabis TaxID=3139334 RepID=UPI0035C88369